MEFTFLGTSGWEQYPGLWCECGNCAKARRLGGRNIRANACGWLAPDCLIDLPPQIAIQAMRHGVALSSARHLLATHTHDDHFTAHWLWGRKLYDDEANRSCSPRFSSLPQLHIYGNSLVCDKVNAIIDKDPGGYAMDATVVEPFKRYVRDGLDFIGVTANHFNRQALNYIISRDGATMLYALDTGRILPETMAFLRKFKFDLVVLEGTYGYGSESETHCNLKAVEEIFASFKGDGLLKDGAKFCVSHISPHFTPVHDEIEPVMAARGITIAYDGMNIKI